VTWFSVGTGVHSGRRMRHLKLSQGLDCGWVELPPSMRTGQSTSFVCLVALVLSPFYVFEKRTSCCGQSQVCKCQVHGAQIVVYHFFHPDFPSNHGNDHVGNCFSASGLIICSLTKDSFVRKPCECCFSHSLGIFKGCP